MWNNKLINEALFFAISKHNGQIMKHPQNMPYSAHIVGVALTAMGYAKDMVTKIDFELLICCALLHDTLEDTETNFDELKSYFGENIANGVLALTKNEMLPKEEQMSDSILRIKAQPIEIAIVKLADRIFNMRDVVPTWSLEKLISYKNEAQLICDSLGYACNQMKVDLQNEIDNYIK